MTIGLEHITVEKFNSNQPIHSEHDVLAIETPVALVYNGISHVVMMATPKDLDYFAIGFSLTEGIIQSLDDIYSIDIIKVTNGFEVHIELSSRRFFELKQKRRNLTGRTGCGICGTEQIEQVCNILPTLSSTHFIELSYFNQALSALKRVQTVGEQTGCTHAAILLDLAGNFIAGFEDIGRHVALDKLLGFRAIQLKKNPNFPQGVIVVSSRASYEMVQKTIHCGIEILMAVSAATSMAVDMAKKSNLTLIGFFKNDKGVIYSASHRIR